MAYRVLMLGLESAISRFNLAWMCAWREKRNGQRDLRIGGSSPFFRLQMGTWLRDLAIVD
ncbi:hypothetical protein SLEP1_g23394 [Rubroshorea leprosula]|uniref:Uncharacterized protein n=1 Tax=Rubroshorea leprosula TaxID=152421 RepID=A0AAV5JJG1_9ROSI|nr:hypothetical protein SLEP1_g23394 [Rubroshorea leprosula]